MRIVILSDQIPPDSPGGAGKVAWMLAQGLQQQGHELHVITATTGKPFEAVQDGITTYHLHSAYPPRLRSWLSLYNPQVIRPMHDLLRRIQPDVVNAHNIHADLSYSSLRVADQLGLPVVFTAHDMMPVVYNKLDHFVGVGIEAQSDLYKVPPLYNLRQNRFRYNPVRNPYIRHILQQHAPQKTALSHSHQQALAANGLPGFEVVYNGLDPQPFMNIEPSAVDSLRDRLQIGNRPVILLGGRLSQQKGSQAILQALDSVAQVIPEVRLLVLSAVPVDMRSLNGLTRLTPDHIIQTGWLSGDDLIAAYHLADVVTFPSIYLDPFGMINLEAMAAAKPLVATCFGGAPEIVINGETGYIVNPLETAAFAERLTHLLLNAELRQQMGLAGQAQLVERFTLKHQVDHMLAIYQKAL